MTDENNKSVPTEVKKPNQDFKPHVKPVRCLECDAMVSPILRVGEALEPENKDIKRSMFWQCPTCKNYVGTSIGVNKKGKIKYEALGSIPTEAVANARSTVYDAIMRVASKLKISKSRVAKKLTPQSCGAFKISSINSVEQAISILKEIQEAENTLKTELENALPREVSESRLRVSNTINNTCETLKVEASKVYEALSSEDGDFNIETINTLEDANTVIAKLRAYRKAIKAQTT